LATVGALHTLVLATVGVIHGAIHGVTHGIVRGAVVTHGIVHGTGMAHGTIPHGTTHITIRQCTTTVTGEDGILRPIITIIILHITTEIAIIA
jgi:hypothetical protein